MKYISLFSGIEAATVAWHHLGWKPIAFAEIEKFPCELLAHHYPNVPNLGDMTKVDWAQWRGMADVLVGGSPCQAFSVAGLRQSLNDARGNLTLEFVRAAKLIRPRFVVWENVPGVLNTADNAFGCFLAALVGADAPLASGEGSWPCAGMVSGPEGTAAWRILDAQFFGLAQRRKRVFLVFCPTGGADPGEILFERPRLLGYPPTRGEAGEGVAGATKEGTGNSLNRGYSIAPGNCQTEDGQADIFVKEIEVSRTLDCTGADPSRK